MATLHCRYCKGEFASLNAYDDHLILYGDIEGPPWGGYRGRPVCLGQKWGRPVIDPNRIRLQELARKHFKRHPVGRRGERMSPVDSGATLP